MEVKGHAGFVSIGDLFVTSDLFYASVTIVLDQGDSHSTTTTTEKVACEVHDGCEEVVVCTEEGTACRWFKGHA